MSDPKISPTGWECLACAACAGCLICGGGTVVIGGLALSTANFL